MYEDEGIARAIAKKGRYGDTMLMHVNPMEVQSMADNGMITINPDTGQPEAFLGALLSLVLGAGSSLAAPVFAAGGALASGIGTALSALPVVGSTLGAIPTAIGGGLTGVGTTAAGIGSVPTALGGLGKLGTSISSLGGQLPKITGMLSGPQGIGQVGGDFLGKLFGSSAAESAVGSLPEGIGKLSIPEFSEGIASFGSGNTIGLDALGGGFQAGSAVTTPVMSPALSVGSIPSLGSASGAGAGVANTLAGSEIANLGSLLPGSPAGTGGLGSLKEMGSGALKFAKANPLAALIGANALDSWTQDDGGGGPSGDDRSDEEKEYWSHYSPRSWA